MTKYIPFDLLILHLKQENSTEEEAALMQWRSTAENEALYSNLVSLWNDIRNESAAYNPDTDYYWKQLHKRIDRMERKKQKSFSVSFRRIHMALAATAASVLLAIIITVSYRMGHSSTQNTHSEVNIQTCKAISGKTQIALPDGSSVWLNQGSALSYETSFLSDRKVQLTGEALFEVRSDAKHPFTVQANEVYVQVSGTRFNVQAYADRQNIRVALLEGKIAVSAEKEELAMIPGDIASFDREIRRLSSTKDDVAFEAFWANNSCTFEAKPLGYICKYLERWYNIKILLDPEIADTQVYTFSVTDEPLEMILRIMSQINPIRYSFNEDRTVTLSNIKPLKK